MVQMDRKRGRNGVTSLKGAWMGRGGVRVVECTRQYLRLAFGVVGWGGQGQPAGPECVAAAGSSLL